MINTGCCNLTNDLENFRRIIESHKHEIYGKYRDAQIETPELEGYISLNVELLKNGVVKSAGIASSSLNNTNLESDIVLIVKGIKFLPLEKNRNIKYKFTFIPN